LISNLPPMPAHANGVRTQKCKKDSITLHVNGVTPLTRRV
jgi:hypothetical protein